MNNIYLSIYLGLPYFLPAMFSGIQCIGLDNFYPFISILHVDAIANGILKFQLQFVYC